MCLCSYSDGDMMTVVTQEQRTDVIYDPSACNRCGMCVEVCPFNVWELPERGAAMMARPEDCTNCTACAKNCLGDAISVTNFGCGCIWNQIARMLSRTKDSDVGAGSEDEACATDSGCDNTSSGCCG